MIWLYFGYAVRDTREHVRINLCLNKHKIQLTNSADVGFTILPADFTANHAAQVAVQNKWIYCILGGGAKQMDLYIV
jgi:hypothetical protein